MEWEKLNKYNKMNATNKCNNKTIDDSLSLVTSIEELNAMTLDGLSYDKPCNLTSMQSFEIIRKYIRDKINLDQAVISADFKFIFVVKKKITIKPYTYMWKNSNGSREIKVNSKKIKHREEEVFEMTPYDGYGGCTFIPGFKGDSLKDLINNVNSYLERLISFINDPVSECPYCNRTGLIIENSTRVKEWKQ